MLERLGITATRLKTPPHMDPRVAWAVDEMKRRIAEPLSVADLAAEVHLSVSHFAHLFRRETGCAPGEFLQALRMMRARALLERTFLTIKEVMAIIGCNDASHFARDFRRFHGMPPREWRGSYGAVSVAAGDAAEPTMPSRATAAFADERQDSPNRFARRARVVASIVNSTRRGKKDTDG